MCQIFLLSWGQKLAQPVAQCCCEVECWLPDTARESQIKRNEIELFVVRWIDLESVIQSEVSQKEKNKYSMLTQIGRASCRERV